MTRVWFPWIGGAALTGGAVFFAEPLRTLVLVGIMLFFPLIDREWQPPALPRKTGHVIAWAVLALMIGALVLAEPRYLTAAASSLLIAALPEEWFFRAYFQGTLESRTRFRGLQSILITSLLFSLIHGLSRDWTTAVLVFVPSLVYGWLYQRTRDLPMLVFVHALSNIVYVMYLSTLVVSIAGPPS